MPDLQQLFDNCIAQISKCDGADINEKSIYSVPPQAKSLQCLTKSLKEFARTEQTLYKLAYMGKKSAIYVYNPLKTPAVIKKILSKIEPKHPTCDEFIKLLEVREYQAKLYKSFYDRIQEWKGNGDLLRQEYNFLDQYNTPILENKAIRDFIGYIKCIKDNKDSPLHKYAKIIKYGIY